MPMVGDERVYGSANTGINHGNACGALCRNYQSPAVVGLKGLAGDAELRARFLDRPEVDGGDFYDRLKGWGVKSLGYSP